MSALKNIKENYEIISWAISRLFPSAFQNNEINISNCWKNKKLKNEASIDFRAASVSIMTLKTSKCFVHIKR